MPNLCTGYRRWLLVNVRASCPRWLLAALIVVVVSSACVIAGLVFLRLASRITRVERGGWSAEFQAAAPPAPLAKTK